MTPAQLDNLLKLLTSKDRTNRELGIIMADEIEGFWEGLVIWGNIPTWYPKKKPWVENWTPNQLKYQAQIGGLKLIESVITCDDFPF